MIHALFIPILLIFILQSTVFLWYLAIRNPTVVDVGWAGTTVFVAMFAVFMRPHANPVGFIMSVLILFWGLRLGSFLFLTRVMLGKVDKRYVALAQNAPSPAFFYFKNFQLQGVLIYVLTLPLQVLPTQVIFNPLIPAGVFLCGLGIFIESLADYQLLKYKNTQGMGVCDRGLWAYSRHPNYFGDWMFWLGIGLMGLSQKVGLSWVSLSSPLMLYVVMTQITAPLTERLSLEKRPLHYARYQQDVPMFFPNISQGLSDFTRWFKKVLSKK